jgi:hypothetical protein
MTTALVAETTLPGPFTTALLLADPLARLACADWLEEQEQQKAAACWRALYPLRLSDWTQEHLERHLAVANDITERRSPRHSARDRLLDLMDCLLAGLEAHFDAQSPGCCCVHGGGVAFGWRRGHTTVCLAVRKPDRTVAVDVGSARARVTGGSPANVWPELVQFRPDVQSCRARLKTWAAQR